MKKNKKIIIIISILILIIVGSIWYRGSALRVKNNINKDVLGICNTYGLQDIRLKIKKERTVDGFGVFYVTIKSSNFNKLSTTQILELEEKLDEDIYFYPALLYFKDYNSGSDKWTISNYPVSIYKNGEKIYEQDYNLNTKEDGNEGKSYTSGRGILVTDNGLKMDIWVCAMDIVRNNLKAPSTAKFCLVSEASVYDDGSDNYTVSGWVDAENGFGAKLRSEFIVTLTFTGKGYTNGYVTFL